MRAAILLVFVIAVVGCTEKPPENEIRASGHVEATDVRLAPEVGGRIVLLTVKEGDRVEAGALILRLDGRDHELAVQRAKADQSQAEAQLRLLQAGSRREDIARRRRRRRPYATNSRRRAPSSRPPKPTCSDSKRCSGPTPGSRKQRDDAATRRDVARERVRATESQLRAAEATVARLKAGARPQEIEAARARVEAAAAQVAASQEAVADTSLAAPIAGVVTEKLVEVGEVIAPRAPVVVISDLVAVWADVFVPEPTVPRIKLGQPATVFTDAGGSGLAGTVTLHLAESGVHAAQRADLRRAIEARVPRSRVGGQQGRRSRSKGCRSRR